MTGEHLDLTSDDFPQPEMPAVERRRFLGVNFACCGVYSRVYANRENTAYCGNCPKCGKPVTFQIGPGGTDERFFTAF